MKRWLLLQLGRAGLAAWATASLVFVLSRLLATGVEEAMLGEATDLQGHFSATSTVARQALRQRLGLEEPVFYVTRSRATAAWHWHGPHNQYHRWLRGLLHGQLGWSYRDGQPIGPKLRAALAYTLPLAVVSAAAALLAALALGLALAGGPATGWRAGLHLVLTSLQGLPIFALAIGLLFLFANPSGLNILPAISSADGLSEPMPGEMALQLVLPALTLVLATLPELTLPLAAALRHELRALYITTARAKGVPAAAVLRRHALPNALLPLLTAFAGLLPTLLAGTVLVETVFAVPGVGRLLAGATATHDYPVVVAGVLLTAGGRLLGLALADGLYAWADPRIRLAS
ncbi:MAG TPA: ABC transporter permease [Hymenobacter sp.]|uniref:ABC transporter permease n=1 Tax=Hymenobacter sp. TaxID=1898978 RepID=UPI002D7E7DBE|nr:ABC transporter permease [Hymenobacter sp.]HET9505599.1 ABC transporter permease [Hymenobacter sp.]